MKYIDYYTSPIGDLYLISDGEYLTELSFKNIKENSISLKQEHLKIFEKTKMWLDIYFKGENPFFIPEIKPEGTKFQLQVWEILNTIKYGQTMTYGEIAKKFSNKMSSQAIGAAVSKNRIPIIIPCHRVLGKNSKLTGYFGGLWRKAKLLDIEGINYK